MVRRLAVLFSVALVLSAVASISLVPAQAAVKVSAQSPGSSSGGHNKPGKGKSSPSPSASPAAAEQPAGPPWTYQMARLALGLLLLLGLGIFLAYRKLVMGRQRAA